MRRIVQILTLLLASIVHATDAFPQQIEARFSPHGGIATAIRQELAAAKVSVRCQAYRFCSTQILAGFIEARQRNIPCFVILDASQAKQDYEFAVALRNAGCTVMLDAAHKINHNKVIIIDDTTLVTGSYNFSAAAESSNAESILFIRHPPTLNAFIADFNLHAAHSKPLTPLSPPVDRLPHPHSRPR